MKSVKNQKLAGRERRHRRIRAKVLGTAERPRLSIFRSNKHIYLQVIDDEKGITLVSASDAGMKASKDTSKKAKGKLEASKAIGEEVAKRARDKKISKVVFDRGGYLYAGRVKQAAEGARAGGLDF
ncbi:MAG: 50S ribosomal protein L18 [Parcubacteria group bacterium]|nr:50S ribosomal protein L18 [Parcubacteria group bacterium]